MKKISIPMLLMLFLLMVSAMYAKSKVKRVDKVEDIDGYWNDNDINIVCKDLIAQCIESPRIAKFEAENGRAPTVIMGKIKNDSAEHIDTSIVAKKFQNEIINSGVLEFVADKYEREALRDEILDQQDHSTEESAGEVDAEEAADYMLQGSVKTDVHQEGKIITRAYTVTVQLMHIQTHRIIFSGQNDSVKKQIKRKKFKI